MNDPPTSRLCEKSIKFLSQKNRASHLTRNAFFGLALCVLIPLFFDYRTIHRLFTQPLRWGYLGKGLHVRGCRLDMNDPPTSLGVFRKNTTAQRM